MPPAHQDPSQPAPQRGVPVPHEEETVSPNMKSVLPPELSW